MFPPQALVVASFVFSHALVAISVACCVTEGFVLASAMSFVAGGMLVSPVVVVVVSSRSRVAQLQPVSSGCRHHYRHYSVCMFFHYKFEKPVLICHDQRPALRPRASSDTRNKTRKTTNRICAIPIAAPARPVNPSSPAISATIKNVSVQFNIRLLSQLIACTTG